VKARVYFLTSFCVPYKPMELEIKNEAELEEAAVRIGQLKDALPGSQDAAELIARMQAMVIYVRQNTTAPDPAEPISA
jgi:hypothetical protein